MTGLDVFGWTGLILAVILQWVFVARYGWGLRWAHDFVGRAIFSKSLVIAVVLTSTGLHAILPEYPGEQPLRVFLMWCVTLSIGYQVWALYRQRREDRARREAPQDTPVEG